MWSSSITSRSLGTDLKFLGNVANAADSLILSFRLGGLFGCSLGFLVPRVLEPSFSVSRNSLIFLLTLSAKLMMPDMFSDWYDDDGRSPVSGLAGVVPLATDAGLRRNGDLGLRGSCTGGFLPNNSIWGGMDFPLGTSAGLQRGDAVVVVVVAATAVSSFM